MAVPSVLAVETAALTAWPGLYTAYDGHWVWRAARGYSNRANSIQCLDPGGDRGGIADSRRCQNRRQLLAERGTGHLNSECRMQNAEFRIR